MSTQEKECYNVSRDVTSVQREGITQEIVKAREHVLNAKDNIIQASVKDKNSSRQLTYNNKSNDSKKSDGNKDSMINNEQAQQPNTSRTVTNTVTSNNKVVLIQTATVVVNSRQNNYNRVKCR